MAIEMKVLRTYDGTEGFVKAGSTVTVNDKQRAAFLKEFGIATPVEEGLNLEVVSYTDQELKDMKQADLRTAAKKLDVEGVGGKTNDELRAAIKAKQITPEQNEREDAPEEPEAPEAPAEDADGAEEDNEE